MTQDCTTLYNGICKYNTTNSYLISFTVTQLNSGATVTFTGDTTFFSTSSAYTIGKMYCAGQCAQQQACTGNVVTTVDGQVC
jgi:hypothetical protein